MPQPLSSTCAYCGLPLPGSAAPTSGAGEEDTDRLRGSARPTPTRYPAEARYCCYGCSFAAAVTRDRGESGAAGWTLTCLGIAIFLSMNVMVFTMALWTQEFYGGTGSEPAYTGVLRSLFRYLCLLFAAPVLVLLGGPLLENAWASCRRGALSADLLLVLGVAASFLYSAVSVVREQGPVYFEIGCGVLVLVTLGKWLEATCKLRTSASLQALHKLLPDEARVLRDDRTEAAVPLAEVAVGDCLRVLPGERIPCDGTVREGSASVDEQALNGESQPVVKEAGQRVFGGSLDLDGELLITVTSPAQSGALSRMIELVDRARLTRGHYERLADRVTAWFLPAVVVIALGTFAWHGWRDGLDHGILAGLAVLLIACPCALGLATPLAVWSALGRAARRHVLFQSGEALEKLALVRAVRFDKTGTLTTGSPEVAQFIVAEAGTEDDVLGVAGDMAAASTHSYAGAIHSFAQSWNRIPILFGAAQDPPGNRSSISSGEPNRVSGRSAYTDRLRGSARVSTCSNEGQDRSTNPRVRTIPGHGLIVETKDGPVYLGSRRLMAQNGCAFSEALAAALAPLEQAGLSFASVGWSGAVRGVFVLREELRPEAAQATEQLRRRGLDLAVLTGDSAARGQALARELGLPVRAELLPEDKVAALAEARQIGPVAMVGDGINDAPALAASDVGIALGCGTDVSRACAAVCLLGNDLRQLPWAIELARRTVRVIRRNLFWAFVYNVLGIGLACSGLLNPVLAALAMVLSSLLVVTNTLSEAEA